MGCLLYRFFFRKLTVLKWHHTVSGQYTKRCVFHTQVKFYKLFDLRSCKHFWIVSWTKNTDYWWCMAVSEELTGWNIWQNHNVEISAKFWRIWIFQPEIMGLQGFLFFICPKRWMATNYAACWHHLNTKWSIINAVFHVWVSFQTAVASFTNMV